MKTFDDYIKDKQIKEFHNLSFIDYLNYLIKSKNIDPCLIYKRTDMSRQTFSKIYSGKMIPSLKNAVKLAIGLELDNNECKLLLKKLNYTLPSSDKFSLVIRYCLDNSIYNILEVNNLLYKECGYTLDD